MSRFRAFIAAASMVNLCFFKQWSDLLAWRSGDPLYEPLSAYPASYLALYLAVAVGALVLGSILRLTDRPTRSAAIFQILLCTFVAFVALNGVRLAWNDERLSLGALRAAGPLATGAVATLLLLTAGIALFRSATVARIFRNAYVMLSPLVILNVAQSFPALFAAEAKAPIAYRGTGDAAPHRVVWMVFDGLDYRATFPERPAGLRLPSLDRLRSQAAFAIEAVQPAEETNKSLPSFLLGRQVSGSLVAGDRPRLRFRFAGGAAESAWDPAQTIFAKVRAMGKRSALIGWYLPYCHLLAEYTDSCESLPHYDQKKLPYRDTIGGSLRSYGEEIARFRWHDNGVHVRNYQAVLERTIRLIEEPSLDFLFVHWPIPHNPVIYEPGSRQLRAALPDSLEGYYANLQLVDRTVAEVRDALVRTGQWDKTTLILTSDHASRAIYFKDGIADERVPFLVKFAGQREGITIHSRLNALIAHDMTLELLAKERGEIVAAIEQDARPRRAFP